MSPIAAVLVGHLLGDWVVQSDWQAANKTRDWVAMTEHLMTYHLTLAMMLMLTHYRHEWAGAWIMAISFVTHGLLDRRWPVVWLLRHTGSPSFAEQPWGVLAADQALHLSILLLAVGL